MYHVVTPCQVSWFPREFWIYTDLKTEIRNVLWPSQDGEMVEFVPIRSMGPKHAPQGNMYVFSSHFGALEHVFVVWIWIMDIKLPRKLNYWIKRSNETWIISNFSVNLPLFRVACRRKYEARRGSDYRLAHKGTRFPIETTRVLATGSGL